MPWQDRIREATYTSAAGNTLRFDFEDVSREIDLRGSAFQFPNADGTYVQRTGVGGRRLPMQVFFWGDDHDLQAAAFDELLRQPGLGRLTHPLYGVLDVVPFGSVTQRDDLKTAANQTVMELTFWETTDLPYPSAQGDPASAVASAVERFNVSAADQFDDLLGIDTAGERAALRNGFSALLGATTSALGPLVSGSSAAFSQFSAIATSIETGLDSLLSDPSTLARQLALLIETPSSVQSRIGQRLVAFGGLLTSVTAAAVPAPSTDSRRANLVHTRDLYATSYVAASAAAVINTTFETKPDALLAAETILGMLDQVTTWRDAQFDEVDAVDTGQAYQGVLDAVLLAAGFLVEISFTLKQERRITLDRARTVIDLAAELYGSVDDQIDFLINSNSLTGSEILELPRGREIVYYV